MKIYILHGWAYSTEKWQPFLEKLNSLNIETELLKIPGLTANLRATWDIDDYIKWLSDTLPPEPVVILGHSNGGRLALNFAWVYPERVSKLILLDSAGVPDKGLSRVKRLGFRFIAKVGKRFTKSPNMKKMLYKLARVKDYYDAPENTKKIMSNLIDSDDSLNLSEINTEISIFWGSEDKITPLRDGVHMQHELPNSVLHIIEGARHSPQFTNINELSRLVKEVL